MTPESDLSWSVVPKGKQLALIVQRGDQTLFLDEINPTRSVARCKTLDELVAQFPQLEPARGDIDAAMMQAGVPVDAGGRTDTRTDADQDGLVSPNPDPAEDPQNGVQLLDDLVGTLTRYMTLPSLAAEIIALWCVHTHVYDVFDFTPRLAITSPDKRCGKTRLMTLISYLVSRPLPVQNITAAAIFRTIDRVHPTLLIDEADSFIIGSNGAEEIRGILNSGFEPNGTTIRLVGDKHEPRAFRVFGPVAIALIGSLSGQLSTVEDRAVVVSMRRRGPRDRVPGRFSGRAVRAGTHDLQRRIVRWAADHREDLTTAQPNTPLELDDRAADLWSPLLAIADEVDQAWGVRARSAAQAAAAARANEDESLGTVVPLPRKVSNEKR